MPETTFEFRSSEAVLQDCLAAGEKYLDLKNLPESRRGDTWEADRRRAAQELIELNSEWDISQRVEKFSMEMAAWQHALQNPPQGELRGPLAAFADLGTGQEYRSAGEQVIESDAYKAHDHRGFEETEVRGLLTGSDIGTTGSNLFVPVGTPFLSQQAVQRRRFFVRDLLSVQQTGLGSVPYIREVDAAVNEGGASAVSEASAKPEVTMQFEQADAPIRKLAAWIQATMEALDDAPTLRGYVDTRLAYMLQIREEQQILAGNGSAPEIKGILDYTGGSLNIQTQSLGSDLFAAVGSAIGKIENVDGDPDGVVVNPTDYWAAMVDRHSDTFDGSPGGNSAPFGAPSPTIWGLPVVRSRAITAGQAIVGAFRVGATLFEREGITIRSTDSHASLFVSNTVVILAEERVGLAVHRPDYFVLVS